MEFEDYDTLSGAMHALIRKGYTTHFLIVADNNHLKCNKTSLHLSPDEFDVDHWYHSDGLSGPRDDMVLFAVSSKNGDERGLVVNAYGVYADDLSSSIINKLKTHLN